MEGKSSMNPEQPQYIPQDNNRRNRLVVMAVLALVVLFTAFMNVDAFIKRNSTGVVSIKTNNKVAKLTISRTNYESLDINKSSARIRLAPGPYRVTATTDKGAASASITVTKKQTTTLDLNIISTASVSRVANFTAQNIRVGANNIYFLNTPFNQLFSYKLGTDSNEAEPYFENVYPVTAAHWFSDTSLLTRNGKGVWYYSSNNTSTAMNNAGFSPDSNAYSFNSKSQIATLDTKGTVLFFNTPTAIAKVLAKITPVTDVKTSLSENGDVVVYQPFNQSTVATVISGAGKITTITSLPQIDNAVWSPDGTKLAIATNDGFVVLALSDNSLQKVTTTTPSNPLSITWIANDTVIYADSGSIWSLQTSGQITNKLAAVEGDIDSLQPFTLSSDKSTLYYGTTPDKDSKGGNIYSLKIPK